MVFWCITVFEDGSEKSFLHLWLSENFPLQLSGAIEMHTILQEERLGLTTKKLNCRPTGTHPSPRSVLGLRSVIRSIFLLSTRTPTLFSPWSLTEGTAPHHWVVTRGRRWLVSRPFYRPIATGKVSMLSVALLLMLKQESVSLETTMEIAISVIPESDLVQEDFRMTRTRVETMRNKTVITGKNTLKQWAISWFSNEEKTFPFLDHKIYMHK